MEGLRVENFHGLAPHTTDREENFIGIVGDESRLLHELLVGAAPVELVLLDDAA